MPKNGLLCFWHLFPSKIAKTALRQHGYYNKVRKEELSQQVINQELKTNREKADSCSDKPLSRFTFVNKQIQYVQIMQ